MKKQAGSTPPRSRKNPGTRNTGAVSATPVATGAQFPIVGVGCSAGGLEALEKFLRNVAPGSGMAIVAIQHLDPAHPSALPDLLQRMTPMAVTEASDGITVEPDHLYVIPPNKDLSLLHDRLRLLDPVAPRGLRPVSYTHLTLPTNREV